MNKVKNVINIKYYDSPCGGMIIGAVGKGLCLCDWRENRHRLRNDNRVKCFFNAVYEEKDSRLLDDALRTSMSFTAEFVWHATATVWTLLAETLHPLIPVFQLP